MVQNNNSRKSGGGISGGGRNLYVRREQQKKRKKLLIRVFAWIVVIALAALIVLGAAKIFGFISGFFKNDFQFTFVPCESWTDHSSITEVKSGYAIGIQYPLINEKTNKAIEKDAKEIIKSFRNEIKKFDHGKKDSRPVYTASYSVAKNSDAYVSVLYTVHRTNPLRKIDDTQYITKIYDISKGEELKVQDIFTEDFPSIISEFVINTLSSDSKYKDEISTRIFTENTKADFANFENIGFSEENLTLYYSAGDIFPTDMGALTVDVPLRKIHQSMKINVTGYVAPLYDADKPMIALTFDDGPNAATTSRILDALESVGGRATFFVLGHRISNESEIVARADKMGCEYGNHSWDHIELPTASKEKIAEQINKTDDALLSVIGKKTALARAPYSSVNKTVFDTVNKPFVSWTVDTNDWKNRDASSIKNEILSSVSDGSIILMHDIYSETAAAVEEVIPELIKEGYQLVTVSELMEARGIEMTPGKIYYSAPIRTK